MTDDAATLAQGATARPWLERIRERLEAEAYEEWDNDLGTRKNRSLLPSRVDYVLASEAPAIEQAEAERDEALALAARLVDTFDHPERYIQPVEVEQARAFLRRHDAQPGGGG